MKFIAFVIILLAVITLNSAVTQTGNPYTLDNLAEGFWCTVSYCSNSNQTNTEQATTNPKITIEQANYLPNDINIKAVTKITLHITNDSGTSCIQAFTIPSLGIQKVIPVGSSDTIEFTAPAKGEDLVFSCSMGMYRGVFHSI
jgi:plastocyanin domain-containing protein